MRWVRTRSVFDGMVFLPIRISNLIDIFLLNNNIYRKFRISSATQAINKHRWKLCNRCVSIPLGFGKKMAKQIYEGYSIEAYREMASAWQFNQRQMTSLQWTRTDSIFRRNRSRWTSTRRFLLWLIIRSMIPFPTIHQEISEHAKWTPIRMMSRIVLRIIQIFDMWLLIRMACYVRTRSKTVQHPSNRA